MSDADIVTKRLRTELSGRVLAEAALGQGIVPRQYHEVLARERGSNRIVVVAAAPKTGSTYLANTLAKALGYPYFRLSSGYGTNEHDLYLPSLVAINSHGCVSQLHMKGTYHNAALMQTFGIRPIILVRNIEDIVVSLSRDLIQKRELPGYHVGMNGYSFIWLDSCMENKSEEEMIDSIIDLAVPWYVNFYVSWQRLCERNAVAGLWVAYEEMMADREKAVRSALDFLGLQAKISLDKELLEARYTTFRQGGSGQGISSLNDDQKRRIARQFKHYPEIDFARYGFKG